MVGRPAKLNEKKGNIDLEREIKNKGDIFLLEEQHENFVAAATKWEILAATNARRKWAAVKKSEREHVLHFLHKKGFWKLLVEVVQNKGKEMYKKVFCKCKVAFFAN